MNESLHNPGIDSSGKLSRRELLTTGIRFVAAIETFGVLSCKNHAGTPPALPANRSAPAQPDTEKDEMGFAAGIRELEKSAIANIDWIHPDGASDEQPINPIAIVGYYHLQSGRLTGGEEQIRVLQRTLKILTTMASKGNGHIFVEGESNDNTINPTPDTEFIRSNLGNSQFRESMETGDPLLFHNLLSSGNSFQHILAAVMQTLDGKPAVKGAENPETFDQLHEFAGNQMQRVIQKSAPAFTKVNRNFTEGSTIEIQSHANAPLTTLHFGGVSLNADELQSLSDLIAMYDTMNNSTSAASSLPFSAQHREDYIAQLPSESIVLFGAGHLNNFREYGDTRSLALIAPEGIPAYALQSNDPPDIEKIRHFLNRANNQLSQNN